MKHQSPDQQIIKFGGYRSDYSFGRRRYDSSIKEYGNLFLGITLYRGFAVGCAEIEKAAGFMAVAIAAMKPTASLINIARGPVVDE